MFGLPGDQRAQLTALAEQLGRCAIALRRGADGSVLHCR